MKFGLKLKRGSAADPAGLLAARARRAQEEGRFRDAAALYAEAAELAARRGPLHVQAGHMFKEAGDLAGAERHYLAAARLMPDDPDLALQLGHFHKIAGRLNDAVAAYTRAAELQPGWDEPRHELDGLRRTGWRMPGDSLEPTVDLDEAALDEVERVPFDPEVAAAYGVMAPENLPKPFSDMVHQSEESINLRQFGVGLNTFWGMKPVLRGVEAIRGFALSETMLVEAAVLVNGLPIHRGPLKGPYELEYEPEKTRIHKYVFNIWCDFSQFARGLYALELRLTDAAGTVRTLEQEFVVEAPLDEAEHPESDGIINLTPGATGTIDEQINARPSAIHEVKLESRIDRVRSIVVFRADQLGDLVASIPGLIRLRERFPEARIVGVFGPANVELARTLNVCDDFVVLDFKESMYQRTRTLTFAEQGQLRDQLAPYQFDIAIDLSQSLMSRPLLALTGAKFLYGFKDPNWPRLSASVDDAYYDPKNHREMARHSTRIVTMIDRLATLFESQARVIRRDDLTRDRLVPFGIGERDRFAVLHTGARIVFSRWPHYDALAVAILRDTDLKVMMFGDARLRDSLSPELQAAGDRLVVIDRQLPFDDFDAALSFCSVYVGNDSGPKHLASLRGVPVVSIHSARINWPEWGQEHTGVIVTRKVPCAGCTLYHDVDECGKDYVCVNGIGLDEVYGAVRRYI